MKKLDYQEKAVEELITKTNHMLKLSTNKTIVFHAPTGSGKTIMMGNYLQKLVNGRTDDKSFSVIWAAPRSLHSQSKLKLEKQYEDSKALKCSFFEDLLDRMIGENEILFLNWESINKTDNIYIRENEQEFNLEKVITRTKDEDRILLLVIDESHHSATADNTRNLINLINATVNIEVSATPKIIGDEKVTVYREDVIAEEMIKKQIVINPDAKNIITKQSGENIKIETTNKETTNELLIKMALAKRKQLKKSLKKMGSDVNPLMLIQLPDKRAEIDLKDDIVSILNKNHKINTENGKLAIYLSEDKENLDTITNNNNPVEVMVFKQAIALGWDCPRAAILVLLRDWKSIVFSIQTVGRIMRMPEIIHYEDEELNKAYIYTNLSDISIHQDITNGYTTINHSKRKSSYQNITLTSCYSKRHREKTRLSPAFIKIFDKATKELDIKNNINLSIKGLNKKLLSDIVIKNTDKEFDHLENNQNLNGNQAIGNVNRDLNEEDVQRIFDSFIIESLSPLFPESRSVARLKESIYRFFINTYPNKYKYGDNKIQLIVLNDKNKPLFLDAINKAKQDYLEEVEKREKELVFVDNWEVPTSVNYSEQYILKNSMLSILKPFYCYEKASTPEIKMFDYLERKEDEIEWWFKNGERDSTFFAVPYTYNNRHLPFYVDWIVKYKNGKIGLFDTKGGITAKEAKEKAKGLTKYIKQENRKGKKLFGGIVITKDNSLWYNDKENYKYDEDKLSEQGWKMLV